MRFIALSHDLLTDRELLIKQSTDTIPLEVKWLITFDCVVLPTLTSNVVCTKS